MSRGRQRVVLVLRVALERGALLRRQLHREVDLACPESEHHRRAALVEGDLDAVHRRRATPVRRVAHERRALLVDVVRELEGAGPDHPALDPRAGIRGDRGGLDDRLVRGLAEQVREDADRRLELEDDRVVALRRDACGIEEGAQAGVRRLGADVLLHARNDVLRGHRLAVVELDALPDLERPLTVASAFGFQLVASTGTS